MRRAMTATAFVQAAALVVFAVSIVVQSERANSTLGKPGAEAAIYAIFAVALAGLAWSLNRGSAWARTPFALMQVFGFIIGYTLLKGTGGWARAAGTAVVVSAAIALAGAVRSGTQRR